jgi:hypothetical protein
MSFSGASRLAPSRPDSPSEDPLRDPTMMEWIQMLGMRAFERGRRPVRLFLPAKYIFTLLQEFKQWPAPFGFHGGIVVARFPAESIIVTVPWGNLELVQTEDEEPTWEFA